jgi:hypothetical protein
VFVADAPNVIAPFNVYSFANVRAVVPELATTPPVTVTFPVPNAVSFPTKTVPAFTVAPPVNVFSLVPPSVNDPLPLFTNPPLPLITPLYTPAPLPPTVNVFTCKFTPPVPAKLPISSLPPNFNTPGDVTVTALPFPTAAPPLTVSVPSFTVVLPVYVFAPPNVNSPAPAFVNANAPPNTPPNTTSLNVVTVAFAVNVPAPFHVSVPFFGPSPMVTLPPKLYAFSKVRSPVGFAVFTSVLRTVTPDIATEPNPNA